MVVRQQYFFKFLSVHLFTLKVTSIFRAKLIGVTLLLKFKNGFMDIISIDYLAVLFLLLFLIKIIYFNVIYSI